MGDLKSYYGACGMVLVCAADRPFLLQLLSHRENANTPFHSGFVPVLPWKAPIQTVFICKLSIPGI